MITILAFGKIAEITGKSSWVEDDVDVDDAASLEENLRKRFPEIGNIPFAIAINKIKALPGDPVPAGATIALLPPFSGG